ncbi:hypothetical protein C0J52_15097 [Blattella germanica]|nr:hypothetical protein C0J52_15097 [Blattella germanica]
MAPLQKSGVLVLLCIVVVEIALISAEVSDGRTQRTRGQGRTPNGRKRQQVVLSLFTIVQFQNQGCAASSGDNGTCLTSAECSERGGVASGPCANGYGPYTAFTLSTVLATCGQSTKENCTYFVNQGYPGPYDGTGSCQLTINKAHPDICQFR